MKWITTPSKAAVGPSNASPLINMRLPFPTAQTSGIGSATAPAPVGSNPFPFDTNDVASINQNHGGEANCLWVNKLNPNVATSATTSQKLMINYMLELEMTCEIPVNYQYITGSTGRTTDGVQGKVVLLPQQSIPTTQTGNYWLFGDALRHTSNNV
jgi:hypothetical protein